MSPLALVTGASSGIGRAFAERLAVEGYDLIVVGRRRDRLDALADSLPGVTVTVVAADLSTDDGIDEVADLCATEQVDMLVNNAGVAHYMPLVDLPASTAGPARGVAGALAQLVASSQTLSAELAGSGVTVHVVCPGIVATEFHEVQGMDLSAIPRMSADDVVTAALAGIGLGEVVIAPGVEDYKLIDAVFAADLAAFGGQSPQLATRYTGAGGDVG